MEVITIPKKITQKDDRVIIPKREYKAFSLWKKKVKVRLDEQWFWSLKWQKKEAEADEAIRAGKVIGPFSDYKKLIAALKSKRK